MLECQKCSAELVKSENRSGAFHCHNCHSVYKYAISEMNCDRIYRAISLMIATVFMLRNFSEQVSSWVATTIIFASLIGTFVFMYFKGELLPYPRTESSIYRTLSFSLFYVAVMISLLGVTLMAPKGVALVASISTVIGILAVMIYKEVQYRK